MDEYIEKSVAIARFTALEVTEPRATMSDAKRAIADTRAANVALVWHGHPAYHNRPAHYEHYEMVQQTENGEPLYKRQYYTLQDNPVAYCSECGKRLCSRFINFCPNCGARMDGKEDADNGTD